MIIIEAVYLIVNNLLFISIENILLLQKKDAKIVFVEVILYSKEAIIEINLNLIFDDFEIVKANQAKLEPFVEI